jgi:DNA polymerase-3 subunit beta
LPDDQVSIERVENELHVECGSSNTKIKGAPADEYPVIPEIEEKHGYSLLAESFCEALGNIVIAAAKNEIRPELSGVFFNFFSDRYAGLTLAATDSYRLAEKKVSVAQGSDPIQCIVPSRTVLEIMRLITTAKDVGGESLVRLWVSDNQIGLRYDNFEMSSRLVDGKYPDYAQIIPAQFKTTATFPVDIMVNKIKAASLFATSGVNAVSFDLNVSDKTLGVSSTSTQTGEHSSTLEADVLGEENSILLNHRYVLDGLQQMDGTKEVEFKVNGGDVPCLFSPKGKEGYLYIVMPVRQ